MAYQNTFLRNSKTLDSFAPPTRQKQNVIWPQTTMVVPKGSTSGSAKPGLRPEGGRTTGPGTPAHPRKQSGCPSPTHFLLLWAPGADTPFPYCPSLCQHRAVMAVLEAVPQLLPLCPVTKTSPPQHTHIHTHVTFMRFS